MLQPVRTFDTATALVDHGRFNFGTYDRPFQRVNPLDADVLPSLPLKPPSALKWLRLKEWQAIQLGDERVFVNVALFNAKLLALAQVKVFDRRHGTLTLYERKLPPWVLRAPQGLLDSTFAHSGRDGHITFRNRLAESRIEVSVDIAPRGGPRVQAEVTALTDGQQPQVVCIPFAENRGMYSHKGLVPARGRVTIDGEHFELSDERAFALLDDHKGYYPYRMRWDWLTAAGRRPDGELVGFNLTRNQSTDQARYNENCLWRAGRAYLLPPVTFTRHPDEHPERWRVHDEAGQVDVSFTIQARSRVDINALLIRSDYDGPLGLCSGTIRAESAAPLEVDGLFGMGERFDLRC